LDIRDLKAYVLLSENLHFGRAADLAHMTPSTLSRLIKRLEEELGCVLFIRDKRTVQMTYAGEQFLAYANESIERWRLFVENLHAPDGGEVAGCLSLFCSVTASYTVLAEILPKVREFYPRIEIQLQTGDQATSLDQVQRGEVDCGIAARPENLSSGIAFRPLMCSSFTVIAPKTDCVVSKLVAKDRVDWSSVPFIVAEQGVARRQVEVLWREWGVAPPVYASVSGHEAVVSMVALGFGVALVPEIVVAHSSLCEYVRKLDVGDISGSFDIGFCALESRLGRPALRAVWSLLDQVDILQS
jgi:LysR family positive regulator for ilvC